MNFKETKNWYRFIGKKISYYFIFCVILGIGLFFLELCFPFAIRLFLSKIELVQSDRIRFWEPINDITLFQVVILISGISILRGSAQWLQLSFSVIISESFKYRIRRKLLQILYRDFSANTASSLNILGEHSNNGAMFLSSLASVIINVIISTLLLLALSRIEPLLTASILMAGVALTSCYFILSKKIKKLGKTNSSMWRKTNQRLGASIRNLPLLKIYGLENSERKKSVSQVKLLKKNFISAAFLSATTQSLPQVIGVSLIFFIVEKGNFSSTVPPGTLLTYIFLTFRLFNYSALATQNLSRVLIVHSEISNLFQWWMSSQIKKRRVPKTNNINTLFSESDELFGWSLRNLHFSFKGSKATAIKNLNLTISPGAVCVISGESGTGKTSLLYLMLGLLPPDQGDVLIHYGKHTYPAHSLTHQFRSKIGYVGPESFLIEGSIRENLIYGLNEKVDNTSMREALRLADCEFVYEHPEQLEHTLTEQGLGLSTGQKQRLALARALLRNPKALVLDEATANLDQQTEDKLIETFRSLKGRMTMIIITHQKKLLSLSDVHLNLSAENELFSLKESA